MLVLTRMAGEKIVLIDRDTDERVATIKVVEWSRDGVVLGLTRMAGEKIAILDNDADEQIGTVQVVDWTRKGVRLGFEFPEKYLILREELLGGGQ